MTYRLMTVVVLAALSTACANHEVRDKLDIQNPTVKETALAPQSVEAGGLERKALKESAGAVPEQADPNSLDAWMQTYGRYMKNRSAGLDGLQESLTALGESANNYDGAKAQCWIATGRAEQADRNGWGFVEESMGEADRLTNGLKAGQRWMGNSTLRTSVTVRSDLWALIGKMKADPRMPYCLPAQKRVACQEVNLMWAGHNAWARSFEDAQAKVDQSIDQLKLAQDDLDKCKVPVPPPPPVVLPPVINLGADALFKFDKSDLANMLPKGKAELDDLAEKLPRSNAKALTIVGHTDRFGTVKYNTGLSQRRADTVVAYLRSKGVTLPMTAKGVASGFPLVVCPGAQTKAVIECLQPNRRVEIRVEQ